MSGLDSALIVAKEYLKNEYYSDIFKAETLLKMVLKEYQQRLKSIEHYEKSNKIDSTERIESALSEQFGIDMYGDNDTTKIGIDTEYFYVSCDKNGKIDIRLNRKAKKLVGLIHAIISR